MGAVSPRPTIIRVNCRRLMAPSLTRSIQPRSSRSSMIGPPWLGVRRRALGAGADRKCLNDEILVRRPPEGQGRALVRARHGQAARDGRPRPSPPPARLAPLDSARAFVPDPLAAETLEPRAPDRGRG